MCVSQDYYKALEDADEKVQLANQIYDLVSNVPSGGHRKAKVCFSTVYTKAHVFYTAATRWQTEPLKQA